METELTKQIKKATHTYRPQMSKMRTIRYADEVTTPTGIVDSIRFEDVDVGPIECKSKEPCNWPKRKENNCKGCIFRKHKIIPQMIITCFEIKITIEDFHSGHGKNFCGNYNYYCVPKKIAPQIAKEIENEPYIGILTWNGKTLRQYKQATYQEISNNIKIMLLYNALKKMV